jgi:hypothetical protein
MRCTHLLNQPVSSNYIVMNHVAEVAALTSWLGSSFEVSSVELKPGPVHEPDDFCRSRIGMSGRRAILKVCSYSRPIKVKHRQASTPASSIFATITYQHTTSHKSHNGLVDYPWLSCSHGCLFISGCLGEATSQPILLAGCLPMNDQETVTLAVPTQDISLARLPLDDALRVLTGLLKLGERPPCHYQKKSSTTLAKSPYRPQPTYHGPRYPDPPFSSRSLANEPS